jgi:ligand-binding sensor domain-containing protein
LFNGEEMVGDATSNSRGLANLATYLIDTPLRLMAKVGELSTSQTITLQPGRRELELVLKDSATLSGRILALNQAPLANVVVQAVVAEESDRSIQRGLLGEYFRITDLEDYPISQFDAPALTRNDLTIDFQAALAGRFPGTVWRHLAVRWTGQIQIEKEAEYTFALEGDDAARLFIDRALVADTRLVTDHRASGKLRLMPGDHDLRVEYYNADHNYLTCKLSWSSGDAPLEIVPSTVLRNRPGGERYATMSNEKGEYRFRDLPTGSYKLRVHAPGRHIYYQDGKSIPVTKGSVTEGLDFQIAPVKKGVWKRFDDGDGLATSRIEDMCVGRDGAVWFASIGGVARYDGNEFHRLTEMNGLASFYVNAMTVGMDGVTWIGTAQGLSRYEKGRMTTLTTKDGLPSDWVRYLASTPDGSIWLITLNPSRKLTRYDGKTFRDFTPEMGGGRFYVKPGRSQARPALFATAHGPAYFDGQRIVPYTVAGRTIGEAITTIHEAANGTVWCATSAGVLRCDTNGVQLLSVADGLISENVEDIVSEPDGAVWFSTYAGVSRFDGVSFLNYKRSDGLAGEDGGHLVLDRNGFLWVGSHYAGVARLDANSLVTYAMADGLPSAYIGASAVTSDGTLWFGTGDNLAPGGLVRYNGNGTFASYTTADGLPGGGVSALLATSEGDLWIGTSGGAARFDGHTFQVFKTTDGLVGQYITEMTRAPDGTIWFASNGSGLSRYDGTRFVNVKRTDGLSSDKILCLTSDKRGRIWTGNNESGGLICYDPNPSSSPTNRFTRFAQPQGLPTDVVTGLAMASDGSLWAGSIAGVSRYDGQKFTTFDRQHGQLGNDFVDKIFEDREGLLWFATQGGVSCFDGEVWSWIDTRDGLPRNFVETITQDREGNMWFGTREGLVRYTKTKTTPRAPTVSIQADREYSDLTALPEIRTGTRLTFQLNVVDLRTRRENRQYRWQIANGHVGADRFVTNRNWSAAALATRFEWSTNRAGDYTVAVQYIDRDLNRSEIALANVAFVLPWYQNARVMLPLGLLNIGLVGWAFTARGLYVRKRREAVRLREQMFEQEHLARVALEAEMHRRQQAEQSLSLIGQPEAERFHISGTLRPDAPSYVERRADRELWECLSSREFGYVLTSRQMGKSSLMVRSTKRLRSQGIQVTTLDLTAFGTNLNPEQWYLGLLMRMAYQLQIEEACETFWKAHEGLSPAQRFFRAIQDVILPRAERALIIFVDELDVVRSLPFSTAEFFAAIREIYNRRAEDPALNKLAFCLLGVATPSELIEDPSMTPFNIGRRIELEDFAREEVAPLTHGLGRPAETATSLMDRIHYWTAGHPYLTQRLCKAVVSNSSVQTAAGLDGLCRELFFTPKAMETDDNLLFARERLLRSAPLTEVLDLYARTLGGERVPCNESSPAVAALRLTGLVGETNGFLHVRNRIYQTVFNREWIEKARRE